MKNRSEKKRLDGNSFLLAVTIILFFVMYIVGIIMFGGRGFAKVQNFLNLFISNAGLIVVATGMTIVMITGGIDISVGSVVAMVCMMLAWMMERGNIGAFPAILIVLATGCIFGLVQGFLVAYLKIQPFIVTLAGMFFARGMTTIVHTAPFNVANEGFAALKDTRINVPGLGTVNKLGKYINAYVEIGVIVAALVVIILFCILKWTKAGRNFYAVGGNEKATRLSGIDTNRVYFLAYLNMGLLAAVAGMITVARLNSANPTAGNNYEMDAIGACFIGGASAYGGTGTVPGVIIGATLMGVLNLGMSIMGVDQNLQKVVKGAVLLAAVIFDVVSKRKPRILYRC